MNECEITIDYCEEHDSLQEWACEKYVEAMHEQIHRLLYKQASQRRSDYDQRSRDEYVKDECPFCTED